jgi:hypothetical protein
MAKLLNPMNSKLHDEMVAQLASSTLVERFSVGYDNGWEISFNKLSEKEFLSIIEITKQTFSSTPKMDLSKFAPEDARAVRVDKLNDGRAQAFARAVAQAFQAEVVK